VTGAPAGFVGPVGPVDKFGRPITAGCFLVGAWRRSSSCGLRLWRVVDVDSDGRVWVVRRASYRDRLTRRSWLCAPRRAMVFDNPPASEAAALAGP